MQKLFNGQDITYIYIYTDDLKTANSYVYIFPCSIHSWASAWNWSYYSSHHYRVGLRGGQCSSQKTAKVTGVI